MQSIIINDQPVLQRVLNNINIKRNNSQAYILSGTSIEYLEKYSILLSKVIICPKIYSENCRKCNICTRINDNNYAELKIIKPNNGIIKKEEIINLRSKYQTNSIEGRNQVYIINEVEKLNVSAANSILKFLEEPDSNTVAIFTTTNIGNVISTVVSRCQVININDRNYEGLDYVIAASGLLEDDIDTVVDIFDSIEKDAEYALCNINNLILERYNTKELVKSFMNVLILIYSDILNYNYFDEFKYFEKYVKLQNNAKNKDIAKTTEKIFFLLENIEKLDYNINILLFMDNLLVGIGAINDGKGSWN